MKARPLRRVVPAHGLLPVEITIRNLADSMVWFHPMFVAGANLRADIVGPDGRPVPLTAAIDPPGPANFGSALIPPGGSFSDTVDLDCALPAAWNGDGRPPPMGAYIEAGSDSLVLSTVTSFEGLKGTFHVLGTDTLVGLLKAVSDVQPYPARKPLPALLIRVDCVTGRPVGTARNPLHRR